MLEHRLDSRKRSAHFVQFGVGSDALTGESSARAENEARQCLRRLKACGDLLPSGRLRQSVVTIHAHQHWKAFRTGCEFYARVADFAHYLSGRMRADEVSLRGASEPLQAEKMSVVLGDVPAIAEHLTVNEHRGQLEYRRRPIAFVGNPNLLPEMIRTGKLTRDAFAGDSVDLRPFHAWRLLSVIHDKVLQQQLLPGTGIEPLRHFEAYTLDEALAGARQLLAHGPVVVKPSSTSGGTGVHTLVPAMSDDQIVSRLSAVVSDCVAKYGPNSEAAILPWRGFEFVRSTGYPLPDGEHLWDLRIAVLFEPGIAQVFPVSMRVTPQPFDPQTFHLEREQWVSNVSGRNKYLLLSGLDDAALAAVGFTPDKLEQAFQAAARWTTKAWDSAARGGGCRGHVYEDYCEQHDDHFYPRLKFAA